MRAGLGRSAMPSDARGCHGGRGSMPATRLSSNHHPNYLQLFPNQYVFYAFFREVQTGLFYAPHFGSSRLSRVWLPSCQCESLVPCAIVCRLQFIRHIHEVLVLSNKRRSSDTPKSHLYGPLGLLFRRFKLALGSLDRVSGITSHKTWVRSGM